MRIIPIEFEFEIWHPNHHTLRLQILHFDSPDGDTALLEVGWYQGEFFWEVLFCNWFIRKYEQWRENQNA